MKIEKVSDNQIRCTLTKEDLADRQLKLSELAYGTEKAKSLFRDMMQQASYEFGFEAEDIPLMIEAIPLSPDCIILIITKVEDPDELDTRFSKFAPAGDTAIEEIENVANAFAEGADDILDLFKKIHEETSNNSEDEGFVPLPETLTARNSQNKNNMDLPVLDITRSFWVDSLDSAIRISHVVAGFYKGSNSLYKNTDTGHYMLFLRKTEHTPEDFNKVCNILAEYATPEKYSTASEAFYEEHYKLILKDSALQHLAEI
ncbi:MAG: adaptor protein MecA [Lachnospiraceae bacterium]|nr:adaptor protein MecA [Lachnospiraceae bacterium]